MVKSTWCTVDEISEGVVSGPRSHLTSYLRNMVRNHGEKTSRAVMSMQVRQVLTDQFFQHTYVLKTSHEEIFG